MDIYERLQQSFDDTKDGSLLDRRLIRKGDVDIDDLHKSLKDALLFSGKITEDDLESYFRNRLRLSGEIRFEDIALETQKLLALKGQISFEDLETVLQNKFKFANISEQQLSTGLLDKINSSYHKENIIIDCGDFDNLEPDEIIDGGDW